MSRPRPCHRHPAHRWIAGCADCTAWHLTAQLPLRRTASSPG
ncbi:hypothetical protein [Geodermatophilus sp. URMC 62]